VTEKDLAHGSNWRSYTVKRKQFVAGVHVHRCNGEAVYNASSKTAKISDGETVVNPVENRLNPDEKMQRDKLVY
jgi:hypothetical protein